LSALQNQISKTRESLKIYQSAVDEKTQNIADMHRKLAQLENIKNNSKDYQKIERIAEQKANDIFSNKKSSSIGSGHICFRGNKESS
jgi:flagellar biosynthesis chaperone FliJ